MDTSRLLASAERLIEFMDAFPYSFGYDGEERYKAFKDEVKACLFAGTNTVVIRDKPFVCDACGWPRVPWDKPRE